MFNLHAEILSKSGKTRQFCVGSSLITTYTCRTRNKFGDNWSHYNYIAYVTKGRKIWHSNNGSFDLREGDCFFVRKGAYIIEHFFESRFCFILFFMPDEFICEVLKRKSTPLHRSGKKYDPIIRIDPNAPVQFFYQSMMSHFDAFHEPDPSLLELKFKELVLTIADNPANSELLSYFSYMLQQPQSVSLQNVMEDNFSFNLKLEEFAKLSSRSLSAFKRDFQKLYNTSPGKWLIEKRLNHALHLLSNLGKTVAEAAFESGFESPSHFSRAFRQRFGVSPLSIKQQIAV
ncbi:MAG: helix-turn-helix domain-containing protein [Bacteroidetes bacterium]|nr:helix-turn-helix domain-containing protein [Bacteroidota bacterium]